MLALDAAHAPLGGAARPVEVPDVAEGKLTLSHVFLSSAATTAAGAREAETPRDAQVLRRFRSGDTLYFQLYVYNAARDGAGASDVVLQAQIHSRREAAVRLEAAAGALAGEGRSAVARGRRHTPGGAGARRLRAAHRRVGSQGERRRLARRRLHRGVARVVRTCRHPQPRPWGCRGRPDLHPEVDHAGPVCTDRGGAVSRCVRRRACAGGRARGQAEIVRLDVVVTDAQGKPVAGLVREDFDVREDGKPQRLTDFVFLGGTERCRDGVRGPGVSRCRQRRPRPGRGGRSRSSSTSRTCPAAASTPRRTSCGDSSATTRRRTTRLRWSSIGSPRHDPADAGPRRPPAGDRAHPRARGRITGGPRRADDGGAGRADPARRPDRAEARDAAAEGGARVRRDPR